MGRLSNGRAVRIGFNHKPYHTKKYSIFAAFPYSRDMVRDDYTTIWERLTEFCKRRSCSRYQAKTFARKKWIAVSGFRNRIYVCEMCTEEIDDWLSRKSRRKS